MPPEVRQAAELYAGCVSGAINRDEYLSLLVSAGFTGVEVRKEHTYDLTDEFLKSSLTADQIAVFRASNAAVVSITVSGRKPS